MRYLWFIKKKHEAYEKKALVLSVVKGKAGWIPFLHGPGQSGHTKALLPGRTQGGTVSVIDLILRGKCKRSQVRRLLEPVQHHW